MAKKALSSMFITSILIIIASITAFFFSNMEFWLLEAFLSDIEVLLVSILAYCACPMYRWRAKITTSLFMCFYVSTTIHNIFIYKDVLTGVIPATVSAILIIIFVFALGYRLFTKWDKLKSDTIEKGYIYEIIGKPRHNVNFLAYIITFGSGGTWARSDGYKIWKFDKITGVQVETDFDPSFIIGKKVIKVGVSTEEKIKRLSNGNGKKWSLINNCLAKFKFGL